MKYVKQFCIIITISFVAEVLEYLLPLPVPASIYGLMLLFLLLVTGAVKLESVQDTADFLVEIMPIMFIPSAVGLIESYTALEGKLIQVMFLLVVTTVIIMVITGLVSQAVIRHGKKKSREGDLQQ